MKNGAFSTRVVNRSILIRIQYKSIIFRVTFRTVFREDVCVIFYCINFFIKFSLLFESEMNIYRHVAFCDLVSNHVNEMMRLIHRSDGITLKFLPKLRLLQRLLIGFKIHRSSSPKFRLQ